MSGGWTPFPVSYRFFYHVACPVVGICGICKEIYLIYQVLSSLRRLYYPYPFVFYPSLPLSYRFFYRVACPVVRVCVLYSDLSALCSGLSDLYSDPMCAAIYLVCPTCVLSFPVRVISLPLSYRFSYRVACPVVRIYLMCTMIHLICTVIYLICAVIYLMCPACVLSFPVRVFHLPLSYRFFDRVACPVVRICVICTVIYLICAGIYLICTVIYPICAAIYLMHPTCELSFPV